MARFRRSVCTYETLFIKIVHSACSMISSVCNVLQNLTFEVDTVQIMNISFFFQFEMMTMGVIKKLKLQKYQAFLYIMYTCHQKCIINVDVRSDEGKDGTDKCIASPTVSIILYWANLKKSLFAVTLPTHQKSPLVGPTQNFFQPFPYKTYRPKRF